MSGGKYWSADNMFGSLESQRADDAEAMFMGTAIGAAKAVAKINKEHDAEIRSLEKTLEQGMANQVNLMAGLEAQQKLNEAMVSEIKDPAGTRRFSDPDADMERCQLLEDTYRQSAERVIRKSIAAGVESMTPFAIDIVREKERAAISKYKDKAYEAQQATRNRRKPG